MPTLVEIETEITSPGGPFEVVEETVLGEPMQVFRRRPRSLRQLIHDSAGFGDKKYLVYEDRRITFAEHARVVASVARALEERFGVRKGDRVAILAANCPEWIVTYWATVSLGAIAVGLNGWWTGDEIRYGLDDAEPRVLFGDRKRLARLAGAPPRFPVVEFESQFADLWSFDADAALPEAPIDEDDPATILYTSGTTGRPKGAVNTHRGIIALNGIQFFHGVRMMLAARDAPREDAPAPPCALITNPLFHVSGLYTGAVTTLAGGVKTVWTSGRFDPVRVMQLIERERVTTWGPMGTMVQRVMSHPDLGRHDLSSLRNIGSGGAPVSADLQEKMRRVFPHVRRSIGVGYGLTECTALATLNYGEELERHPDSVGRPLATVQIEIRDADGKRVPDGCEGEIHIKGPLVMRDYCAGALAAQRRLGPARGRPTLRQLAQAGPHPARR
jgi:acyl-CoA synthetase (AMP-forming)/AMP-acid ligase II